MKPQERQNANINHLINEGAKMTEHKDIKIVTFNKTIRGENRPCLMVWMGKQSKAFINYYYLNTDSRKEAIEGAMKRSGERTEYKTEKKAERKAFVPDVKIGDIYCSSWGYDQTNVDFYQVIDIMGKCTVKIREIKQRIEEGSGMSHGMACNVLPVKDDFIDDEVFTKRIGKYGIRFSSFQSASKWDGKPMYNSWYA